MRRQLFLRARALSCVQRGPYAKVSSDDVARFEGLVPGGVLTDEIESYNCDWMKKWSGRTAAVLKPKTTEEVSAILRYCDSKKIAVVPQGGNTGLVGGSVPVFDEVVLSTRNMNKILDFKDGIVKVEAGCILEVLDDFLKEKGFRAPLDLGAKGSCTIGGNASTNAGGIRFLRYGSLRGNIVGLECVLANGTVLDCGFSTAMKKDNTGYALDQLMIGAEGTLGIITKVALAVPPSSKAVSVALFSVESFDKVLALLDLARESFAEILSAIEFFDSTALASVLKADALKDPLSEDAETFRVLIETSGSNADHDREKLETFLSESYESDLVSNGVLADSLDKARDLWRLREGISDAMTNSGYVYKYDVSLPLENLYDLVDQTRKRLHQHYDPADVVVAGYGHLGDSNLHLNVCSTRGQDDALLGLLEPWVFDRVLEHKGSVSAEHGIGRCKNTYLATAKPPEIIHAMRHLKLLFDPNAILNPYKVLPPP